MELSNRGKAFALASALGAATVPAGVAKAQEVRVERLPNGVISLTNASEKPSAPMQAAGDKFVPQTSQKNWDNACVPKAIWDKMTSFGQKQVKPCSANNELPVAPQGTVICAPGTASIIAYGVSDPRLPFNQVATGAMSYGEPKKAHDEYGNEFQNTKPKIFYGAVTVLPRIMEGSPIQVTTYGQESALLSMRRQSTAHVPPPDSATTPTHLLEFVPDVSYKPFDKSSGNVPVPQSYRDAVGTLGTALNAARSKNPGTMEYKVDPIDPKKFVVRGTNVGATRCYTQD